jgi:hypothetical protein
MEPQLNDSFPVIIERRLKMRTAPGADLVDVIIEIGQPYWTIAGGEAACPVAIRGAIGRVQDIHSIDPMAAMGQAIAFVDIYLKRSSGGTKFYWPTGEEY